MYSLLSGAAVSALKDSLGHSRPLRLLLSHPALLLRKVGARKREQQAKVPPQRYAPVRRKAQFLQRRRSNIQEHPNRLVLFRWG